LLIIFCCQFHSQPGVKYSAILFVTKFCFEFYSCYRHTSLPCSAFLVVTLTVTMIRQFIEPAAVDSAVTGRRAPVAEDDSRHTPILIIIIIVVIVIVLVIIILIVIIVVCYKRGQSSLVYVERFNTLNIGLTLVKTGGFASLYVSDVLLLLYLLILNNGILLRCTLLHG